jgi:arginase
MASKSIRILGVPIGLGSGRPGGEAGPRAIRAAGLHDELRSLGISFRDDGSLDPPGADVAEGDPSARYLPAIAERCADVSAWMRRILEAGETPLVLGGDHSIAAGAVAGASAHFRDRGEAIGLLWIDAHGDMNTPESSPSGNVHGMPLAASLGMGPRLLTHLEGFAPKVARERTVLIGIRDIDPSEARLIADSGVTYFTMRDIDERGMFQVMHEAIEHASYGTAGVHVSFDMDVLDPTVAPGVGTPVLGGLTYREAHLALEMLADFDMLVSMDVVECDPMLDEHNRTAHAAVKLIGSAFGKRILPSRSTNLVVPSSPAEVRPAGA